MNSKIGHIYLYVSNLKNSYDFYSKFLPLLNYKETVNEEWGFSFNNEGTSIWFEEARPGHVDKGYHRKRVGLNHVSFRVESKREVDRFYKEFIKSNGLKTLYATPKHFPQYEASYYALYFEDPDRIKLEVSYYP